MDIRISAGALALRVVSAEDAKICHYMGLINSAKFRREGVKMFGALGGGVELTENGRKFLQENYGAHSFEGNDARFLVPEGHVDSVLEFFENRDLEMYGLDPNNEIRDELTKEKIAGVGPILSAGEANQTVAKFVKTVRQPVPVDGSGTSAREQKGVPTRRVFFVYDLIIPVVLVAKMRNSDAVRYLKQSEVETTKGGASKGITEDGLTIADNVFIV